MGITHEWNGTVLTITSDSGTSSVDLKGEKGEKGDTGIRGAQGEAGIVIDATGEKILVGIDSALDSIIAIQNSLIGGESE